VVVFTLAVKNIVRGRIGRQWMMIRDMDIAAELMGVRPLFAKLSAFAVSSYICAVSPARCSCSSIWARPSRAFSITLSFQVLFMAILGGLGSLVGSFFGAAFIWGCRSCCARGCRPLALISVRKPSSTSRQLVIGALIIFFPHCRAAWPGKALVTRQGETRVWPFPYG
jgi:branched-chain amino acid transport system permease protein